MLRADVVPKMDRGHRQRQAALLPQGKPARQERRVYRELGEAAVCAGVHRHAFRLKALPLFWTFCRGFFGRFTRGLEQAFH